MVGPSAGVSAALIPIRTQSIGSPTGGATLWTSSCRSFPVRPTGRAGTTRLIWAAEGVTGLGRRQASEMAGLTFGVPGVAATGANTGTAIDSGIAGLNTSGSNIELIRMRVFRTHLQYTLAKFSTSVGYAQVEARNLDRFSTNPSLTTPSAAALTLYPKLQYAYVPAFYDAANWLRFSGEVNQTKATYNDPNNRFATWNNRYQVSGVFHVLGAVFARTVKGSPVRLRPFFRWPVVRGRGVN